MDVRLALLYSNTVAIRSELAELQQSIGAASYQVGKELEVCSLSFILAFTAYTLQDNIKKYSRLVFLSSNIFHYSGKIPKEHMSVRRRLTPDGHTPHIPFRNLFSGIGLASLQT